MGKVSARKKENRKRTMDQKTWLATLEKFKHLPPPTIEETERCYHEELRKIIRDDFTYQCQNPICNAIIDVVGSAMYNPQQYAIKSQIITKHLMETDQGTAEMMAGFLPELHSSKMGKNDLGDAENRMNIDH